MATKSAPPARSASQIEADLAAARSRLTSTIETLIDQVHPQRVKQRSRERLDAYVAAKRAYAKTKINRAKVQLNQAATQLDPVKAQVIDSHGRWRTDRLALGGGGLAGLIALVVVLRKLVARRRR